MAVANEQLARICGLIFFESPETGVKMIYVMPPLHVISVQFGHKTKF